MKQKELLGDKAERLLTKFGGKKLANRLQRVTGRPCGCAKRKQTLNNLHQSYLNKNTPKKST